MYGWQTVLQHHDLLSVVVNNLDVERIASLEAEAYAPSVINADAPLAGAIMLQGFQSVRRRQAQVFNPSCGIQLRKAYHRSSLNGRRKAARLSCRVETFGCGISKRSNHDNNVNY
jgi:hypothetical protein